MRLVLVVWLRAIVRGCRIGVSGVIGRVGQIEGRMRWPWKGELRELA